MKRSAVARLLDRARSASSSATASSALPIAVFKRFGEHDGGRLAATVSYYSFFSVFPLLLVFVTVLGIVLQDNADLREDLVDGALGQIPVIGSQLADTDSLPGDGLGPRRSASLTALWAGLGAVAALQHGLDIDRRRPGARARQLRRQEAARASPSSSCFGDRPRRCPRSLSNLATLFDVGSARRGARPARHVRSSTPLLLLDDVHRAAGPAACRCASCCPGVVVGAVGLVVLQQLGSFVVRRYIAGASDTYGTFAIVIALLSWFFLVSRVVLLSAQS